MRAQAQLPLQAAGRPAERRAVFALRNVQWNAVFFGFLLYMFTIISYFVRLGDAAIAIALVGLLMMNKPWRMPLHLVLFGVYIIWAAIGLASTAWPDVVRERVWDYAKLWLIALVAVNALRTRAQIQAYLLFVIGCYLLFPARGTIVNYIGGWSPAGRAVWSYIYANTNDLAALTLLAMGVAAAVFVSEGDRRLRLGALGAALLFAGVVLMTQSRGALVALAVFVMLSLRGQRRKLRSVMFIVVCGTVVITMAPSGVWERAAGLVHVTDLENLADVDPEQSAEQRVEIWKVAANIIRDEPVQGIGLGAYPEAHYVYALNRGKRIAFGKRDTHSTYLNILAETGVPGLLLFLGMIGAVFLHAERSRRRLREFAPAEANRLWFLELGLAAYLVAGIWGSFPQLAFLHISMAAVVATAYLAAPAVRRLPAGPGRQPGQAMRVRSA